MLQHVLTTARNIKKHMYDKKKIMYLSLLESYTWKVYRAVVGNSDNWEVMRFIEEHSCVPNRVCELMKIPIIASLFLDKIRDEPSYYLPMKIQEIIKEKWCINVSRPQCQAARNKAVKWIAIEYEKEFARLRDYGAEIVDSNPNSTVEIDIVPDDDGVDVLNRLFVCFDVLKRLWRETCQSIIGVDECFLKSTMKGQLLTAIGRDGNNGIYPIAFVVFQVEDTNNWSWFFRSVRVIWG